MTTTLPTEDTFDVIIIGARIAGAAAAALVAQQGARVLLLERATFPATTVSCPVFYGNSMEVLDRMGVLADVEAIGAPHITHYGFRTPEFDLVARLPESHGYDFAYSIRREVLDTAILRRIQQDPLITLREGFSVTEIVSGAERVVGVRGHAKGGPTETFYARGVVGADGKHSFVARKLGAQKYANIKGETAFFYAYYRNFAPIEHPSAIIYGDPQEQRGVLVFDADSGLTVVSTGIPAADFETARTDPAAALEAAWRSIPELAERGRAAERATQVMGQAPMDSFYRQSYGPGWALVGDAGHYLDPATGQGINHALQSASLFSEAWERTQRRASWETAMAEYQRRRDAATRPMFDLVAFGTQMQGLQQTPGIVQELGMEVGNALFRAIARQPDVAARYIGMFNGSTPVRSFMNPVNLAQVLVKDGLRNELPRIAERLRAG